MRSRWPWSWNGSSERADPPLHRPEEMSRLPTSPRSSRFSRLTGSLFASFGGLGLLFLLYHKTLGFPLTADDWSWVNGGRHWVWAAFSGDCLGRGNSPLGLYRPLVTVSFWADWRLHTGWAPGYHVTNLLLHLLASAVVGAAARTLGELAWPWAILSGLFFLVSDHMAQTVAFSAG